MKKQPFTISESVDLIKSIARPVKIMDFDTNSGQTSRQGRPGSAREMLQLGLEKGRYDFNISKAEGEGSRGGKVTGHTGSGKPVYASSKQMKSQQLEKQADSVRRAAEKAPDDVKKRLMAKHKKLTALSQETGRGESSPFLHRSMPSVSDCLNDLCKSTDWGSTKAARIQEITVPGHKEDKNAQASGEYLKNTHGEQFHTDNDKLVERMVTEVDEIHPYETGAYPRKMILKDNEGRKIGEIILEEEPDADNKKSISEICDLLKANKIVKPYTGGFKHAKTSVHPLVAGKIARDKKEAEKKRKGFVKAEGPGGLVFDFGHITGNPCADNASYLLNKMSDPAQTSIVKMQKASYDKALTDYVKKGDSGMISDVSTEWDKQLSTPIDQQVVRAYKEGALDDTQSQMHHPVYSETQVSVGGKIFKAQSETDKFFIDMVKGSTAKEDPNAITIDLTRPVHSNSITLDLATGKATDITGKEIA